jgi:hypothetical protein
MSKFENKYVVTTACFFEGTEEEIIGIEVKVLEKWR